ncbi:L-lactate permease [Altererythrobacter sp. SALINAS58]|uniref:L-lactate permease n=1 Tax=Alteripontixanthobacter muriae TaxID=2705546 RepID=UPI00157592AA|nr:L-lactate permease [Alteripontixanthobacter muriae]NTZ44006.1 L-lactate permease [Alteripontixanthobacter muriae]
MMQLLALLPILILLIGMIGLGWTAAKAGLAGAATAIALAIIAFDYGTDPASLLGPLLEAGFTAATILWIVFPALALYEFQTRSGASQQIGDWLASVSDRREVQALVLAWFFALLLEGAAGFGTPIALVAPMLVSLGFSPHRSLLLALIGHVAAVSFGAVGTPMVPLLEALPGEPRILSATIMLFHAALGWTLTFLLFRLARPPTGAAWGAAPVAALLFLIPALALAWLAGPELPALGGALIGGLLFISFARWRWPAGPGAKSVDGMAVLRSGLPYALVLAIILATRTIPPIAQALQGFTLEWSMAGRFSSTVAPLYHPGTMLMLALGGAAMARRGEPGQMVPSLASAAARLPSVALALVAVLLLARVMVHSVMIAALAEGAAGMLGSQWPLAVPLVGALGSFVTGSATASNILLADFQLTAAGATALSPLLGLAGQGFGAAIGNVIAPHNIVAGAATVGLVGREGSILKFTLPVCLVYAGLAGLLLYAVATLS